jgi:hypothetical protein
MTTSKQQQSASASPEIQPARHNNQENFLLRLAQAGQAAGVKIAITDRYDVYLPSEPGTTPIYETGDTLGGATSNTLPPETGNGSNGPIDAPGDSEQPTKQVYRFNVIVAMEWQPSPAEQRLLVEAFRRASAFLYDVTDGRMAFGQMIIGGMELMNYADIQIMASNRLNPRSWVSALEDKTKYMPIRIGRGIWHKNRRMSIPWVEPEGYRALIHEWAHYALGLRDEYLETRQVPLDGAVYSLIFPTISLATESIMGSLEGTSELVPLWGGDSADRKQRIWDKITRRYPLATPDELTNSGPYKPPSDLANVPAFLVNGAKRSLAIFDDRKAVGSQKSGLLLTVPGCIIDEHCWVYVVKPDLENPRQVIAQGTLDARALTDSFQLLDAEKGDAIVLIGQHQDGQPVVLTGTIDATTQKPSAENRQSSSDRLAVVTWHPGPATPQPLPLVDVLAEACDPQQATANIEVYVGSKDQADQKDQQEQPESVAIFPLGQQLRQPMLIPAEDRPGLWQRQDKAAITLDGHVLLRWKNGATLICTYSQGGGPATHVASQGSPITAGSAEGNVMIFFKDDQSRRYGNVRLVTTLLYGHHQLPPNAQPRSYLFSVTSNEPLPINLTPTLIMYFDSAAVHDRGDLRIYRLDDRDQWQPMPTFIPRGSSFAAMPMSAETAPNLVKREGPRIEHYRLFWMPDERAHGANIA